MAKIKKRKCGKCGRKGHNKQTCKNKAKKKKAVRKKKKVVRKKAKKKAKKKKAVKRAKKVRRGSSVTHTRRGTSIVGKRGWLALYHGGSTGKTQHDKTWAVKVEKSGRGYRLLTRWGRRAGQKNVTKHRVTTRDKAESKADSLILQKLNKGYVFMGANRKRRRRRIRRR